MVNRLSVPALLKYKLPFLDIKVASLSKRVIEKDLREPKAPRDLFGLKPTFAVFHRLIARLAGVVPEHAHFKCFNANVHAHFIIQRPTNETANVFV